MGFRPLSVVVVLCVAAVVHADDLDWRRVPHLAVPQMTAAPMIDGQVTAAEWLTAAELGPLRVGPSGVSDDLTRRTWIGYDQQGVYIAFQLHRPIGSEQPRWPAEEGRIDSARGGDIIEIMFAPKLQYKNGYNFWIFANNAFGDAKLDPKKVKHWDTNWDHAARTTPFGWEGEVALPWSALDCDGPPPADEWWAFDFVDNRRSPFGLLGHWSYRGQLWHTFMNFGRIRFDPDVPAVRLEHAGDLGDGRTGVEFAVVNPGATAKQVDVELHVHRRKPGAEGGPQSYFENVESGMAHDLTTEFTKGVDLDQIVGYAMKYYEPVLNAGSKVSLDAQPGQRRTAGFTRDGGEGEFLLQYHVQSEGETVYRGVTTFRIEPPLAIEVEPYWLYSQVIDVKADLRKLTGREMTSAIFSVTPPDGGEPIVQEKVAVGANAIDVTATLPTESLEPGGYKVRVAVLDKAGNTTATNEIAIERPQTPVWFDNDEGLRTEVSKPWTPMQYADGGKRVSMWNRTYDMSGVLPRSMTAGGVEVLASPIALNFTVGGELIAWRVEQFKARQTAAGKAVYDVKLSSKVGEIAGEMTVEFDGMVWYDLKLTPRDKTLTIDKADLAVDLAPQFADLMSRHKFHLDEGLTNNVPKPAKDGRPGRLDHHQMPFTPYLWIGNEQGGVGFTAEAPIDWHITQPDRVLETLPARDGQPAGMRIHMIDAPLTLEQPMRLEFGLQATPIRPMPPHEVLYLVQSGGPITNEEYVKNITDAGANAAIFYYHWRGDVKANGAPGVPFPPATPEEDAELRAGIELCHRYGMKVMVYTGWGVQADSDAWKAFGYELGKYPIQNKGWGTYVQSAGLNGGYGDLMAYYHANLARAYGMDGILYDSTGNITNDRNARIGNTWTDREGNIRPRYAVRATRDLYRRIYNIYNGESRPEGLVYNHGGSMWPINVYAHILNRGEGRPMIAPTLRDCWTPFEEFRAEYSGEPFGLRFSGDKNDHKRLPMRVSTHLTVFLLHANWPKGGSWNPKHWGYDYTDRPIIPMWSIFKWLPYDDTTVSHMYFHDKQVVNLKPARLKSSSFVSGDGKRAIAVVSNLDTTPAAGAEVTFDFKAMGLDDGDVTVTDALLDQPVELRGRTIKVDIDQQRYRLLKLQVH